jgi:hypothetical protein
MKKLLTHTLIFFVLLSASTALVWFMPGTYPHDLAALVNKREMLKAKRHPCMIFIGGSSLLTLKSRLFEKQFHYSVANMSLWGGLGTKEYLEEIKPYLHPGDVVVVTMEYAADIDKDYIHFIHTNEESKKFFFLMSPGRHAREYLEKGNYFDLFKVVMELSQIKVTSYIRNLVTGNVRHLFDSGFPNYHKEFDENGDRTKPFTIFRPLNDTGADFSYPDNKNFLFLNDFNEYAKSKKVRMFFYFSPFPIGEYKANEKYISAFYEMMKRMAKFPLLNKPSDFMYPKEYFADTIYHLNQRGEKIRSAALIRMLEKAL